MQADTEARSTPRPPISPHSDHFCFLCSAVIAASARSEHFLFSGKPGLVTQVLFSLGGSA